MLLYMHRQNKGGENVSQKGRPTANKKNKRLEIRLTPDELKLIQECADKLGVSKTYIINEGIKLVKVKLDKKE